LKASGSMDAANILKPALARGAIRVIGAPLTTSPVNPSASTNSSSPMWTSKF
jgi:hypothetical protein